MRSHRNPAAINGMNLHGGLIPYGGTFLAFSDYARNAIRLFALMKVDTIHVMTQDSIGPGEGGPTHQPAEHLASLRAIPSLNVFRPADAVETLECWDIALRSRTVTSLLALSRQAVPQVRTEPDEENLSARGAYVLHEPQGGRDVTILATGTEVQLALEASDALADRGVLAAVVSMLCRALFDNQPEEYRQSVPSTGATNRLVAESITPWSLTVGAVEADLHPGPDTEAGVVVGVVPAPALS
jgi:transketolase